MAEEIDSIKMRDLMNEYEADWKNKLYEMDYSSAITKENPTLGPGPDIGPFVVEPSSVLGGSTDFEIFTDTASLDDDTSSTSTLTAGSSASSPGDLPTSDGWTDSWNMEDFSDLWSDPLSLATNDSNNFDGFSSNSPLSTSPLDISPMSTSPKPIIPDSSNTSHKQKSSQIILSSPKASEVRPPLISSINTKTVLANPTSIISNNQPIITAPVISSITPPGTIIPHAKIIPYINNAPKRFKSESFNSIVPQPQQLTSKNNNSRLSIISSPNQTNQNIFPTPNYSPHSSGYSSTSPPLSPDSGCSPSYYEPHPKTFTTIPKFVTSPNVNAVSSTVLLTPPETNRSMSSTPSRISDTSTRIVKVSQNRLASLSCSSKPIFTTQNGSHKFTLAKPIDKKAGSPIISGAKLLPNNITTSVASGIKATITAGNSIIKSSTLQNLGDRQILFNMPRGTNPNRFVFNISKESVNNNQIQLVPNKKPLAHRIVQPVKTTIHTVSGGLGPRELAQRRHVSTLTDTASPTPSTFTPSTFTPSTVSPSTFTPSTFTRLVTPKLEDTDSDDEKSMPGKNEPLRLTEEERKIAEKEMMKFPSHGPLSSLQEKNLKTIRRKLRNKTSAQRSRQRKKEHLDKIEEQNLGLNNTIKEKDQQLEEIKNKLSKSQAEIQKKDDTIRKLSEQLEKFKTLMHRDSPLPHAPHHHSSRNQPSTFLFMMVLSVALFVYPSVLHKPDTQLVSQPKPTPQGNTRSLLEAANTKFGQCQEDEELDMEQRADALCALSAHDYAPPAKRARYAPVRNLCKALAPPKALETPKYAATPSSGIKSLPQVASDVSLEDAKVPPRLDPLKAEASNKKDIKLVIENMHNHPVVHHEDVEMVDFVKVEHDPFVESSPKPPLQKRDHNWTNVQKSSFDDLASSLILEIANSLSGKRFTEESLD